jgi:hypothetical protein
MVKIPRPALAGSNSQSPIQTPRTSRISGPLGVAVVQAAASIVSPSAIAASAFMSVSLVRVAAKARV